MPKTAQRMRELAPGSQIDCYELLCKVGQGGMAAVWLARAGASDAGDALDDGALGGDDAGAAGRDSGHGQHLVALKTILPSLVRDEAVQTMLRDEARIALAIDHPNVVRTLGMGQLGAAPYLVLEYVDGESIEQLCHALSERRMHVPAAIVVRIVADAARGMHATHELADRGGASLNVVHRDLSPPNILVDARGRTRVIDFGVAMASGRATPRTADGVMKGRIPYMAPEHASGQPVDRRADVWSLGAVAYYMLSGRHPFAADTIAARLVRILGEDPADALPESVSSPVREAVLRALSKDIDARYASAAELATALEASKLPATHEEVAAFVAEVLAAARKARRALVDEAIAASIDRARARRRRAADSNAANRPSTTTSEGRATATAAHAQRSGDGAHADEASASSDAGMGTLGSVTRPTNETAKPWVPWVGAAAVAALIAGAFIVGSVSTSPGERPAAGARAAIGLAGDAPAQNVGESVASATDATRASASGTATSGSAAGAKSDRDRSAVSTPSAEVFGNDAGEHASTEGNEPRAPERR